jgi:hypothetical protein
MQVPIISEWPSYQEQNFGDVETEEFVGMVVVKLRTCLKNKSNIYLPTTGHIIFSKNIKKIIVL